MATLYTEAISTFYDESTHKRLRDYVYGNSRALAAINFALHHIPPAATRVLDLGCGIGWSSWEILRHHPSAVIMGVDISSRQMQTAKQLFPHPQLNWLVSDMTQRESFQPDSFDAIVMIDVYEHLPLVSRPTLHHVFRHILKPQGVIILTCPSTFHQNYLRTEKPDGLQPVDEDVSLADLVQLAHDIEGEVMSFAYQTIWHTNDYTYTVIQKQPQFCPKPSTSIRTRTIHIEPQRLRYKRVKTQLGVEVTPPPNTPSPLRRSLRRLRHKLGAK